MLRDAYLLRMDAAALRKHIPDSEIPRPTDFGSVVKYWFWRGVYPFFADIRNGLLALHILHHEGRQNYLLGHLAQGRTVEDFLKYLATHQFGNHFVAWEDDGELIGLRRLDGFEGQYHLRIFKDGEVRGHYEFTPEAHPYKHFFEHGEEERRPDFLKFCGDWIVPAA